jgi:hypothetical protein
MDSRKATALLKGVIAAMALVCVIALAMHPTMGIGLALVGLLVVPVLLWLLSPESHDAPLVLEPRRLSQTWVLVFRFQRPPPLPL